MHGRGRPEIAGAIAETRVAALLANEEVREHYLARGGSLSFVESVGLTAWVGLDEYCVLLDAAVETLGQDILIDRARALVLTETVGGRFSAIPRTGAPQDALVASLPQFWNASFRNAGTLRIERTEGSSELRLHIEGTLPELESSEGWRAMLSGSLLGVLDAVGAKGRVRLRHEDGHPVYRVTLHDEADSDVDISPASGHYSLDRHEPSPGDTVRGRYRLLRLIGRGGFGRVWEADDRRTGRTVALKWLSGTITAQQVVALRREAQALALIPTPHIVRILDVETPDDGRPFLVLERLRGMPLGALTTTRDSLSYESACAIAKQALRGVAAAHEVDMVHGDIKPGNIFVQSIGPEEYMVKLLDFGLAGRAGEKREGTTLGYAAPEVLSGSEGLTKAADVYALGATIFELLTGKVPFPVEDYASRRELRQAVSSIPPPLASEKADVPRAVDWFLQRALRRDPAARYRDGAEMLRACARAFG